MDIKNITQTKMNEKIKESIEEPKTIKQVLEDIKQIRFEFDMRLNQITVEYNTACTMNNFKLQESLRWQHRNILQSQLALDHYTELLSTQPRMKDNVMEIVQAIRIKYLT